MATQDAQTVTPDILDGSARRGYIIDEYAARIAHRMGSAMDGWPEAKRQQVLVLLRNLSPAQRAELLPDTGNPDVFAAMEQFIRALVEEMDTP